MRSVTGIVELTLALSLRQCEGSSGAPAYLAASLTTLTQLVTAIGELDAARAQDMVGAVIELDRACVMALLG